MLVEGEEHMENDHINMKCRFSWRDEREVQNSQLFGIIILMINYKYNHPKLDLWTEKLIIIHVLVFTLFISLQPVRGGTIVWR